MAKANKHHWLYRLWVKLRGLLALVVVLAGVCVGLLSLLLPFESLYQQRLEQFLQKQWGIEVEVGTIDGSWRGYGPHFMLYDLKLSGKQSIQLESARLYINVYQLLLPGGRTGIDLSINKAELDMIHGAQGASITINDDADEARFTEIMDRILTTGSLQVDELTLNLANEAGEVLLAGLKADFLLEQDENNRALKLLVKPDDQAQQIEIKSVGLRNQSLTRDAQWHIQFDQFELQQLQELVGDTQLPAGQLDGALWLSAVDGVIQSAHGTVTWSDQVRDVSLALQIRHQGQQKEWQSTWQFSDIQVQGQALPDFAVQMQRARQISQVKSQHIPLALLWQFVAAIDQGQALGVGVDASIAGSIDLFEASYGHDSQTWDGGFIRFSELAGEHERYQFSGLAGEFVFAGQSGALLLDSTAGQLRLPDVFRGQAQWQNLSAQASVDWAQAEPTIELNSLWCECNDFNLQVWLALHLAEVPEIKLNSRVSAVDVTALWKYWPHNGWKPKTLEWLDRGLLAGQVADGFVFTHGQLVKKAFKSGAANFISRAYLHDLTNLFHPEWPVVERMNGSALFTDDSVHVELTDAVTAGIWVEQAQVDIASFDEGLLTVDLHGHSQDNQLLDYIHQSPLVGNLKLSENISIAGQQTLDMAFDLSIKSGAKQSFNPQGVIAFKDGRFATEHFAIEQINGPVQLDGYQLKLKDVPAALKGAAVTLNGQVLTKGPEGLSVNVDMGGLLDADFLLDVVQQELPIKGRSNWNINIATEQQDLVMTARSDLSGVAIQLPAPLNKAEAEIKSFLVKCQIPCQDTDVELNYNNQIKSTISSEAGQYHLSRLQFMASADGAVEAADFGGSIASLDLDRWLSLMSNGALSSEVGEQPEWLAEGIQLKIAELRFMSRTFTDMTLLIERQATSYQIQVDSEAIKGVVEIDDDVKQKGIVAQFEHLHWLDPMETDDTSPDDGDSVQVPDIHLWADHFTYAGVPLGQFRMEMRNVADGVQIEQVSLKSPLAEINVSGEWLHSGAAAGQSRFNVVMFSEKIADFLRSVGFNAPISNAQMLIEMSASWDGVPSDFNVAKIDGTLDIQIGQGEVLDQEPGFGRVLGLFNLTNLPRRLILDFRDVLAEGLHFSSMEGHFDIKKGVANTQDFLIKASSARIFIRGDVGFADQSYAQTITIRPQIGKTFPTIGAIAGGPVGAAAGFLVQGILDKQLKNRNEIIYQVTGTWDDPQIELVSDE